MTELTLVVLLVCAAPPSPATGAAKPKEPPQLSPYLLRGFGTPLRMRRTALVFMPRTTKLVQGRVLVPAGHWRVGTIPYFTELARYVWRLDGGRGPHPALERPALVRMAPFYGDRLPVSEKEFHGHGGNGPVRGIPFEKAREFCRHRGGRLPTPYEWEIMARGSAYYKVWSWGEAIPLVCASRKASECSAQIAERDLSPLGFRFMGVYPHWTEENGRAVVKGGLDGGWFYALVSSRRAPSNVPRSLIVFRCVYPARR